MSKIFLLEDDINLNNGIRTALEKDGHKIVSCYSFFEGAKAYSREKYDLFLLDINLPDGNGLDLCRIIREDGKTPVIFITANDTEDDMLKGFDMGCDDYIAKPFFIEVLRQKVLAVLRRSSESRETTEKAKSKFTYRDLTMDFQKMIVTVGGRDCHFTATEYKLLKFLIENQGQVLTRDIILSRIFDEEGKFIDKNSLNVYIKRLRQKIEPDPKNPQYVITVFGIGYTFGE